MFEIDCKAVVDAFHTHIIDQYEFGCLAKDCKAIFSSNANFTPMFY